MLNVPLWTEIFLENRNALLRRITQFEESLDKIKGFIAGEQKAELQETLRIVRNRRAAMGGP
jgi:prephenate dehydrogenase